MLATIHDDTQNVHNMQHIIPNLKLFGYSDIPVVAMNRLKNPPTWLKMVTTLEKPPTPTHSNERVIVNSLRPSDVYMRQ